MLGYLCVLLMVKAVVVLLSWDVRLPLCIGMLGYLCVLLIVKAVVDSQSCSSTALVGC